MTFALAVASRNAVVVAADRRLSGVPSLRNHLATKLCRVETPDAHGIMTYAGVGARASQRPLELSRWLENLLIGPPRTFDQTIDAINVAATKQGLKRKAASHTFLFAGFLNGNPIIERLTSERINDESEQFKAKYGLDFGRNRIFGPHLPNAHGGYGAKREMISAIMEGRQPDYDKVLMPIGTKIEMTSSDKF